MFFIGESHSEQWRNYHSIIYPCDNWAFLSMPIFCKMDDYGMASRMGIPKEDEEFEKELDELSASAFRVFRQHVFFTGKDTYNYRESDWFRGSKGSSGSRHASYFYCPPKDEEKAGLAGLNKETRFSTFIVRRDIYDWIMTNVAKKEGSEEFEKKVVNRFKLTERFPQSQYPLAESDRKEFSELFHNSRISTGSNTREGFGLHNEMHHLINSIFESEKRPREYKERLLNRIGEQIRFAYALWDISCPILPNVCMSPQCGWYELDAKSPLVQFNRFRCKVATKQLRIVGSGGSFL